MMNFNRVEVRYFPCFTIKDSCLGEVTGFFNADDCSYFNENDRGVVVDSERALCVYDKLTKKDMEVLKTLYQNLVDEIAANPDDSLKVTDFRFERRVSYVRIERLEVI